MSKYNVRRKAQLGLDIREGGIAIPIAPNMYYMNGRSHDEGGIGIGPNNKNGLEVEGGEVVKVGNRDIKVFSSVPLLRGVSPAQLVMGGANPNKVFKAQESFKDRNRINDDGTRYEVGGEKRIYIPNKSIQRQIQETGKITIGGAPTIGGLRTRAYMYGLKQAIKYPTKISNVIRNVGSKIKQYLVDKSFSYEPDFVPMKTWKYATGRILNQQVTGNKGSAWVRTGKLISDAINDEEKEMKAGGIYIKPSKRGTFTAAAKKRGMGVQEFASKVLANKEDYSPAMVKKANFARNASRWKKELGGDDTKTAALKRLRNKFTIAGDYGGGMFGGAGAGSVIMEQPEYVNDTIIKRYLIPVTQTFNDAFRNARNSGQNEFMFDGKLYNTNLGDNPNNNTAGDSRTSTIIIPIEHKEVRRRKKEYGGNMIYEINGNVKNGLMSARPKAQYGKEKKINEDTKIGDDGLIYKRDARGEWWTDGTTYQNSKYYMRERPVQSGGKRSTGEVVKPKVQTQSLPEVVVTAKAPKSDKIIKPNKASKFEGIKLSTLEEDYMTGKRRSANRHPVPDFVGEVNKGKEVVSSNVSSIPRKGRTKATTSNATSKSTPTIQDTVNQITRDAIYRSNTPKIDLSKAKMPTFDVSQLGSKETKTAKAKLNTSSTGGGKQSADGRWIPQFNPITTRDWIGLGSNLAGHIASYFTNNTLLSKYPTPVKPVMAQAAKLKTTHNINPELTNNREVELTNRGVVRHNTQSSNTSIAREQRIMNEARNARNQLYGRKENIETQLINQDRLNRQSVHQRNVAAYNDWLDKTFVAKNNKLIAKQQNMMNLISGIPMAVNNIIGNIESRQATNNTIKAIAAANPNVDGRLLGIGDYYTQRLGDGRIAIYDKKGKLKKYV